jgi:hypothetical protein
MVSARDFVSSPPEGEATMPVDVGTGVGERAGSGVCANASGATTKRRIPARRRTARALFFIVCAPLWASA